MGSLLVFLFANVRRLADYVCEWLYWIQERDATESGPHLDTAEPVMDVDEAAVRAPHRPGGAMGEQHGIRTQRSSFIRRRLNIHESQ